jgi:hypothetical protein
MPGSGSVSLVEKLGSSAGDLFDRGSSTITVITAIAHSDEAEITRNGLKQHIDVPNRFTKTQVIAKYGRSEDGHDLWMSLLSYIRTTWRLF